MPSLRIPLVGSLTDRKTNAVLSDANDQQFTNCFPEIVQNKITGKTELWLGKRQGTAASADVQASATAYGGAIVWTTNTATTSPVVFAFLKSTGQSTMFFDSDGSQIGADIATSGGCPFMAETSINGTGTLTATVLNYPITALGMWYFPQGGTWTQITDGDFPSSVTASHAHMDGYMFVMTQSGRIYSSDLNSLSSWTANSYISLSGGGNGQGVARHRNFIVGFSDYATEFFYNAGNASGSVLSRVRDGVIRIGVARSGTLQAPYFKAVGDSIYWIGQSADNGAKGIYRLKDVGAEKISNSTVDKLAADGQVSNILGSFSLNGMTHVAFSSFVDTILCYCVDTGIWWLLSPPVTPAAIIGAVNVSGFSKAYLTGTNSAKVWTFDPNAPVWRDNGSTYTMTVRMGNADLGTRRKKYWKSVGLIGDSQTSTCNVSISASDDDYATFTTARDIDLSAVPPIKLTRWGASRRRAWQMTNNSNTPCRLQVMEVEYDLGAS